MTVRFVPKSPMPAKTAKNVRPTARSPNWPGESRRAASRNQTTPIACETPRAVASDRKRLRAPLSHAAATASGDGGAAGVSSADEGAGEMLADNVDLAFGHQRIHRQRQHLLGR